MTTPIPCPKCDADLSVHGEVYLNGTVSAEQDPESKARADLVLECEECGAGWFAFLAFADFLANPIEKEGS